LPENRRKVDETRWDVGRVYQRKRVDELAWRALVTTRRKRWMHQERRQGIHHDEDAGNKHDGEKPVPRFRRGSA